MDVTPHSAPRKLGTFAGVSRRCSELLHKTIISQSIVSSTLEVPKSFDVIRERVFESHRTGESGVLEVLVDRQLIKGITSKDELDPMLKALAVQTTVNAEMVISAAAIILSLDRRRCLYCGLPDVRGLGAREMDIGTELGEED